MIPTAVSRYARLLLRLAHDERAARARRTLLGRYWALLLPLLESGAFAVVFGLLLQVRGTSSAYLPFAYVGVFTWRVFSRGVVTAAGSVTRSGNLLLATPLPVSLMISASGGAALLDGLIGLPVLFGVIAAIEGLPSLGGLVVWLPVGAFLHVAATLGVSLLVGVANAFYRDVGMVLGPALAILMFAAPVVYPVSLIPEWGRGAFLVNPISAAIESYRAGLLGTEPVAHGILIAAAAAATAVVLIGLIVARQLDRRTREVL